MWVHNRFRILTLSCIKRLTVISLILEIALSLKFLSFGGFFSQHWLRHITWPIQWTAQSNMDFAPRRSVRQVTWIQSAWVSHIQVRKSQTLAGGSYHLNLFSIATDALGSQVRVGCGTANYCVVQARPTGSFSFWTHRMWQVLITRCSHFEARARTCLQRMTGLLAKPKFRVVLWLLGHWQLFLGDRYV